MTNPDNVGGLPVFVSYDIERRLSDAYACGMNGDPFDMLNARRVIDKSVHAYAELCRAAPAGGGDVKCSCVHSDIADGAIELLDSVIDQIDSNDYQGGISLALYNDITGFLGNPKDSAPAGSGEVEGLADELEHMAETDYNTGCCNSDYPIAAASRLMRTAAALLRKLQQGADYVMVPRDSAKMVTHVCGEWIDLFRAAPGIEKYERYSYEPAVEELRDEYAAIAASQGQEGGHARD